MTGACRPLLWLLVLVAIAGCAGPKRLYVRPRGSPDQFEADKSRCDQELGVNTAVGDPSTKIAYMLSGMYVEQMDRCLRARGWTRQE